jgi:hypothetical protein
VIHRCVELWFTLFLVRCKYYFGWYMGEGGFVASGFSYNGRDAAGRIRWYLIPPSLSARSAWAYTCAALWGYLCSLGTECPTTVLLVWSCRRTCAR